MSEWFHVGQKVVCINAGGDGDGLSWGGPEATPVEGRVYTISCIFRHPRRGILMLQMEEISRAAICEKVHGHRGYGAHRFRPLRKRKTSIEIFRAMLNPAKQGELA